jgi:hypothetical protein
VDSSWGWVRNDLVMATREGAFVMVETLARPYDGLVPPLRREAYDTTWEPRKVLEALARA